MKHFCRKVLWPDAAYVELLNRAAIGVFMRIQEIWVTPDRTTPLLFKTEEGQPQRPKGEEDPKSAAFEDDDEEAWYVCKHCRNRLAHSSARKVMQGSHTHTFANPSGVVFEIACFSSARGYSFLGPSSTEFSWFSGYSWRIVVCSVCITHLGWIFSSQDGNSFFGLITDRIIFLADRKT